MTNISILLVEDSPINSQQISDLLRHAGYSIKHISSDNSHASDSSTVPTAQEKKAIACLASASMLDDTITETLRTQILIISNNKGSPKRRSNSLLCLDNLQLNRHTRRAHVNDQEMDLTSIQFSLLKTFLENLGVVMSKSKLYQIVLNREFGPHDRSLDMHLSRLRRKLTDLGWQGERLKTVHGKGYCME